MEGLLLSLFNKEGASVYGVAALTMALVKLLPKLTRAIPPTLGAVILSTVFVKLLKLPVKTLADVAGTSTFTGGWSVLPKFGLPNVPFSVETLQVILPYAMTMAAVGAIESLLTLQLVDGMMDDGKRASTNNECIGQGAGNIVSGLTGGIGGCALVGQSVINVQSGGGVSRWSGMSMAIFLAAGIVAAAPLLGAVPVASLVGVMLLVSQATFSWSSLRILRRIPKLDAAVIALVSIFTVQKDLAVAVIAGTICSALGFAWKQSTRLGVTSEMEGEKKLYRLHGPLFFGSTGRFASLFNSKSDPTDVVIDFEGSRVMDHSALKAIHTLGEQYGEAGKTIYLRHLSRDCASLLERLYKERCEKIEIDKNTDPVYGVAVRYSSDIPL
jgi:SulP family sulfate permease